METASKTLEIRELAMFYVGPGLVETDASIPHCWNGTLMFYDCSCWDKEKLPDGL
jgi:hypothetical protein